MRSGADVVDPEASSPDTGLVTLTLTVQWMDTDAVLRVTNIRVH
jgi:hypothetical protein